MKCVFDENRECPIGSREEPLLGERTITLKDMPEFCNACTNRDQLRKLIENFKVLKAQLILGMLAAFPNEPEKAKANYQAVMKYVEEW